MLFLTRFLVLGAAISGSCAQDLYTSDYLAEGGGSRVYKEVGPSSYTLSWDNVLNVVSGRGWNPGAYR
jgi:hypothetical protein